MLDRKPNLRAAFGASEVQTRIYERVEIARAAKRLTRTFARRTFLRVVDKSHGKVIGALQLTKMLQEC